MKKQTVLKIALAALALSVIYVPTTGYLGMVPGPSGVFIPNGIVQREYSFIWAIFQTWHIAWDILALEWAGIIFVSAFLWVMATRPAKRPDKIT